MIMAQQFGGGDGGDTLVDFREVDVSGLRWNKSHRGAYASVGTKKIQVQTPAMRCSATPKVMAHSTGWTIDLYLSNDDICTKFVDFLRDLQSSAAQWGQLGDTLTMSDAVYQNGYQSRFRLTAFSDVQIFDIDRNQISTMDGMKACICLLQFQGAWTANERWGLSWKVLQVKQVEEPEAPAAEAGGGGTAQAPPVKCLL
jgi:hypothetical protein